MNWLFYGYWAFVCLYILALAWARQRIGHFREIAASARKEAATERRAFELLTRALEEADIAWGAVRVDKNGQPVAPDAECVAVRILFERGES